MSQKKKRDPSLVPVVIFGQTYKVRAEENVAYIEELARYVDTKMRTIAGSAGAGDALKVAILASLNIADEFFKVEEGLRSEDTEIIQTAKELVSELEDSLSEPSQT